MYVTMEGNKSITRNNEPKVRDRDVIISNLGLSPAGCISPHFIDLGHVWVITSLI